MKIKLLLYILQYFGKIYWLRTKALEYSKFYLYKYHLVPIVEEINHEKIYKNQSCLFTDTIQLNAFKNGVIEYFLKPNNYVLNVKDIAIALNISVHGYCNDSFNSNVVINAATYIVQKIKERLILDGIFTNILQWIGKSPYSIVTKSNYNEIEKIFNDNTLLFSNYFNIYSKKSYSETITIYYPGNGKSWLDWKEEESLKVLIYTHDIPCGFFLCGFDYKSESLGRLHYAKRIGSNEYFNPFNKKGGKVIWAR